MTIRKTKEEAARELARYHFLLDSSMTSIFRIFSPNEEDTNEPIKLVEVTPNSDETGTVDAFLFTPSNDIEYWTAVALVTPEELKLIYRKILDLPEDWDISNSKEYSRNEILSMENRAS